MDGLLKNRPAGFTPTETGAATGGGNTDGDVDEGVSIGMKFGGGGSGSGISDILSFCGRTGLLYKDVYFSRSPLAVILSSRLRISSGWPA